MDPNFRPARYYIAHAYRDMGMYEDALEEYDLLDYLYGKGIIYAKMGKTQEAKKVLNEIMEQPPLLVPRNRIAEICFALGDFDQGFAWLEKGYEDREHGFCWIKIFPVSESVRSDPRFQALLKKMDLE